jgi:Spy/CpxP family protein refolding chaperone
MKKRSIGLAAAAVAVLFAAGTLTQGVLYAGEMHAKGAKWGKGDSGKCMVKGERFTDRGEKFMAHGKKYKARGEKSMAAKKLKMLVRHSKELGLTDEQVEKIADIKRDLKKDRITLKAQIKVLDVDIRALAKRDTIEVDKIRPLIEKKYEAKKELTMKDIAALADAKGLLTAEQIKKAKELGREKRHACGPKGKGKHHQRGAPDRFERKHAA